MNAKQARKLTEEKVEAEKAKQRDEAEVRKARCEDAMRRGQEDGVQLYAREVAANVRKAAGEGRREAKWGLRIESEETGQHYLEGVKETVARLLDKDGYQHEGKIKYCSHDIWEGSYDLSWAGCEYVCHYLGFTIKW